MLEDLAATEDTACRVLVLSMHHAGDEVHDCISLGAAGYLTKDADRAVIVDAIRTVAAGGTARESEILAGARPALRRPASPPASTSAPPR